MKGLELARAKGLGFPLALGILMLVLALDGLPEALRYDRDLVLAGEYWRMLTANLVHLGWGHLALNLAGLAIVWLFFGPLLPATAWTALTLASGLATSGGLLAFNPGLQGYVGLSGALHGLFLAGVLTQWPLRRRESLLLLAAVTAKLAWEQLAGPLPGSERTAGGPVIVDAHLYGAVGGALGWVGGRLWGRLRRRSGSEKCQV